MWTIHIADANIEWSATNNAYLDSVIHIIKFVTNICSMTVAGPLKGYMIGFRLRSDCVQGTNGAFINSNVYSKRFLTILFELTRAHQRDMLIYEDNGRTLTDPTYKGVLLIRTVALMLRCK